MSRAYSAARLVGKAVAKQKYERLCSEAHDHVVEAFRLLALPTVTINDHKQLTGAMRSALCAAQELENMAKGNPAPDPAP